MKQGNKGRSLSRQTAVLCSLVLTAGAIQLPAGLAVPVNAAEVFAELYVSPVRGMPCGKSRTA